MRVTKKNPQQEINRQIKLATKMFAEVYNNNADGMVPAVTVSKTSMGYIIDSCFVPEGFDELKIDPIHALEEVRYVAWIWGGEK